ncbi:MAG TPA: MFS transporter [Gaiellales bacterium]|nr:MFS transporter [Gaiellales bacterium]
MRIPKAIAPLREREFRLLFCGQSISLIGDNLAPIALAFAILDDGGSATDVGIVYSANILARVAFMLVGGVWADRLSRRRVMLAADVARAVCTGVLAVAVIAGGAPLALFVAMVAVHGVGAAFFTPASTGLVPQTVGAPLLQRANALLGIAHSGGSVLGPAAGGAVIALSGPGTALATDAGTFVASAAALLAMRPPEHDRGDVGSGFLSDLADGWAEFRARTWVWVVVLQYAVWHMLVLAPFMVLGAVVARDELGGAGAWAVILAASGVGELAGGIVALRLRPRWPLRAATWAGLLWAPQVALLALREPAWLIGAAALVAGAGMAFSMAVWNTALHEHVPARSLARVSSYDWAGTLVFLPLGFALAGPAADAASISTVLWLGVTWSLASAAIVLAVPSVRAMGRVDYSLSSGA